MKNPFLYLSFQHVFERGYLTYLALSLSMSAVPPYNYAGWHVVNELTLSHILDKRL